MTSPAPADPAATGPVETRWLTMPRQLPWTPRVTAADAEGALRDAKTLAEDDI